jgi:hypothetical protein
MRLSEAIGLGSMILKPYQNMRYHDDKGCALDMAMAASGDNKRRFWGRWVDAHEVWPWLNEKPVRGFFRYSYAGLIVEMFGEVMYGKKSLDQLIDYVRSVEPPELEEVANGDSAQTSAATKPVCAK